jgi:hypothetical protein
MSDIRVVKIEGADTVLVIDEVTGLSELIEIAEAADKTSLDIVVEHQPELSSRRFFVQ